MKTNQKAQIGPMSLEDIYPMAMAFIIVFVYLSYIFSSVSGNLESKNAESVYRTATNLLEILSSRSIFVYEKRPGLFDSSVLDDYAYSYEELESLYGLPGYGFSIEVRDLADNSRAWSFGQSDNENTSVSLSSPIAIRYRVDLVHEGLLDVRVWRK